MAGLWWRQTPHGGDPLFRADPPSDGRWQRGEPVGNLYFADSEQTAWAEWHSALAEFAIPPERQMPRALWRWQVDVGEVGDRSNAERLAAVGLDAPRRCSQWPVFQDAWRAAVGNVRGILAPSAARPSQHVLCLFREADELAGAVPLRPPTTYGRAPAPPTGMTT